MKNLGGARLMSLALVLTLSGCGPRVAPEDLGKIVYEVPKVPGSEKPYPVPPLEDAPAAEISPSGGRAEQVKPPVAGPAQGGDAESAVGKPGSGAAPAAAEPAAKQP